MSAVDGLGWYGDLLNMAWTYIDFKYWSIERDEIYIKLSTGGDVQNTWALWAVNASQPVPVRVYDSPPFNVTSEDMSWYNR